MLAKILTGTTLGLDGVLIEVEVDVAGRGFPSFTIVGLPNKAIDEAKDRVRTAIVNASYEMPDSRLTINLAPADIPKEGSSFDLPITVGILAACGYIQSTRMAESLFLGELSLEGQVRQVSGVIAIALMAKQKGIQNIFLPAENAAEAAMIDGLDVYPVKTIGELILHLNENKLIAPIPTQELSLSINKTDSTYDFADIRGQEQAKRALEIAAAGFHNIHLKGVPGAGKTLLARSFAGILPPLHRDEVLEVTSIYSVAGLLGRSSFVCHPPFRSPHHTTSRIGLIGGGTYPQPGEVSLAHRGTLFLDEFPEFPRSVLESLRQPLEDGYVSISRASRHITYPSRFLLLAASNPCPCGFLGHPRKSCECSPGAILRYQKRLSGPLLDRIDLHVTIAPVEEEKLTSGEKAEESRVIRDRVMKARLRQQQRYYNLKTKTNSELSMAEVKNFCQLSTDATTLLKLALTKLSLSARSYFKIIKTSQTIADLANEDIIRQDFIAEALQYRVVE